MASSIRKLGFPAAAIIALLSPAKAVKAQGIQPLMEPHFVQVGPQHYDGQWQNIYLGSMATGAQNLYTARRLIEAAAIEPASEALGTRKAWYGRLLQGIAVDGLLNYGTASLMHEIWGHGAAAREYGCYPDYDLAAPLKGLGMGNNSGCFYYFPEKEKKLVMVTGGTEATQYLSHDIAARMMLYGGSYFNGLLYINAKIDITKNILLDSNPWLWPEDNPREASSSLPKYSGDATKYWLLNKQLRDDPGFLFWSLYFGAAYNVLFDPMFIYSTFLVGRYIVTGKTKFDMPSVLPSTNFVLTPEGPDMYLRFYSRIPASPSRQFLLDPYIRQTWNNNGNSYGAGLDATFATNDYILRAGGDIWNQPNSAGWGGGGHAGLDIKVSRDFWVGGNVSAKTDGYILGQGANEGINCDFRIGF